MDSLLLIVNRGFSDFNY